MRKRVWLLANIAVSLVTILAGYFVVTHRQDILDWWTLRSYSAPANIKQLADNDTMINRGRDLFYVSNPQIEDSANFNMHCSHTGEKSLVLGCYAGQRIYVYNVTDARLAGVIQVTAAHEMLHAAYGRLDTNTKQSLNAMLQTEISKVTDPRLKDLINLYNQAEPGELLNEMHSILGTEYGDLSPALEAYYKQYFADRSKIVAYAAKYEAVFTTSKVELAQMEAQLNAINNQINANAAEITTKKAALEAEIAELTALRSSDPAAYNKRVPSYNAEVRNYNDLVISTRQLVDTYNDLVKRHNSEAAAQTDLYHSLDSHYQTVAN